MFRFSIRELVLLTMVVALSIGWGLAQWRSQRLVRSLALMENEARLMTAAVASLHKDIEQIETGLTAYGLKLVWSRDMRPSVQELTPAGLQPEHR